MKKKITSRKKNLKKQLAAGALAVILAMFPWSSSAHAQTNIVIRPDANPAGTSSPFATLAQADANTAFTGSYNAPGRVRFEHGSSIRFGTDISLTGRFNIDRRSVVFDATAVDYVRAKATGTIANEAPVYLHIDGRNSIAGFINDSPDNNQGTQLLQFNNVLVGNFGITAANSPTAVIGIWNRNASFDYYDIYMDRGGFHSNHGGAIYIERGTLTITDGGADQVSRVYSPSFTDNQKTTTHAANRGGSYGGAIYVDYGQIDVFKGIFGVDPRNQYNATPVRGNSAVQGGAVYLLGNRDSGTPHLFVTSTFVANSATQFGGGIYSNANTNIFGSEFGFFDGSHFTAAGANTATKGGAIYFSSQGNNWSRTLNIGGTIAKVGETSIDLTRTYFYRNAATYSAGAEGSGGGIYFSGVNNNILNNGYANSILNVNDTYFKENSAEGAGNQVDGVFGRSGGGAIAATRTQVNIGTDAVDPYDRTSAVTQDAGNVVFTDNMATGSGGAIKIAGVQMYNGALPTSGINAILNVGKADGSGDIRNEFRTNQANYTGGSIPAATDGYGGAIYAYNANVNIYNGTLFTAWLDAATSQIPSEAHGNQAQHGGAIAMEGAVSSGSISFDLLVDGSTFTYNRATNNPRLQHAETIGWLGEGGAIWTDGAKLTLTNSAFGDANGDSQNHQRGNHAYERGGAIYLGRTNYSAPTANGSNSNPQIHTVTDSNFYYNKAQSATGTIDGITKNHVSTSGGAIYINQSIADIVGTSSPILFEGNVASMREYNAVNAWANGGGAIALSDAQGLKTAATYFNTSVSIDNASFDRNRAGTAFSLDVDNKIAADSSMNEALGGGNGGAILVNNATNFSLDNATLDHNMAIGYRSATKVTYDIANTIGIVDSGGYGGAIHLQRIVDVTGSYKNVASNHTITNSAFSGNVSENYGGAISAVTLTIGLQAGGNTNGESPLAVFIGDTTTPGGVDFTGNSSYVGGAIYGLSSVLHVNNAVLTNNVADETLKLDVGDTDRLLGKGGGIAIEGHQVGLINNVGTTQFQAGVLNLNNTTLTSNTAAESGGGLYSNLALVNIGSTGTVTFDGNTAMLGGGAYLGKTHDTDTDANLTTNTNVITDTTFTGNIATEAHMGARDTGRLDNSNAQDYYDREVRGGGLYLYQSKANLSNVDFTGNSVEKPTVASDTMTDAQSWLHGGGAIAISDDQTDPTFEAGLTMTGTNTITGNTAQGHGGGIYSRNATILNIAGTTFDQNAATFHLANDPNQIGGDGGAIAIFRDSTAGNAGTVPYVITGDTFTANTADGYGGAISIRDLNLDDLEVTVTTGTSFTANTAGKSGGALYANNAATTVTGTTFTDNTAVENGGAIAAEAGVLTVGAAGAANAVTISGDGVNQNAKQGGGIYVGDDGSGVFADSTVTNTTVENSVAVRGGGVYYAGTETTGTPHQVVQSTFDGNIATGDPSSEADGVFGGGIAAVDTAEVSVEGSSFTGNQVVPTGATNTAANTYGGGAIAVLDGATLTVGASGNIRSAFDNNTADGNGGAIFARSAAPVAVTSTDFTGNTATAGNSGAHGGSGGAIQLEQTDATIGGATAGENVTFTTNIADRNGGAVNSVDADLTVINTAMDGNVAGGTGGAINVSRTDNIGGPKTTTITNSTLTGNEATGQGGGLAMINSSGDPAALALRVEAIGGNTTFSGNESTAATNAGTTGHDIYLSNVGATFDAGVDANNDPYAITIASGLESNREIVKTGLGALNFTADSKAGTGSTTTPSLDVQAGTLGVGGGAIVSIDGITQMTEDTILAIELDGRYQVVDPTNTDLDLNRAALETGSFVFNATGGANAPKVVLTGFGGGGKPDVDDCADYPGGNNVIYTLVKSETDIIKGNFSYEIDGAAQINQLTESDYLWYQVIDTTGPNADKVIQIGAGLVWNLQYTDGVTNTGKAHGTFDIKSQANGGPGTFTLKESLSNVTDATVRDPGWDGTTLTKKGDGILVLAAANDYSGVTTIETGTLVAAHATNNIIDAVGPNTVVVDPGATFQVGAFGMTCTSMGTESITGTLTNDVTGGGNFAVSAGTGVVTIAKANTFTGKTTIYSGKLDLQNVLGIGSNSGETNRPVEIESNGTLSLNLTGDQDFNRILTDGTSATGGTLEKLNANTVTVNGANSGFSGTVDIRAGKLIANHAAVDASDTMIIDAFGSGTVAVSGGASAELVLAGELQNFVTGNGDLIVNLTDPTGYVTLGNGDSANSNYGGLTDVQSGNVRLTNLNGTGANASDKEVRLNGGSVLDIVANGTYNKQITGGGSVEKHTSGELILTNGASNYDGGTTVTNGGATLTLTHVNAAGDGFIDMQADGSILHVNASNAANDNVGFDNDVLGAGDVRFNPGSGKTLTVSGDSTYTGHTAVQSGNVRLTNLSGTGENISGTETRVTIESGANLDLAGNAAGDYYKNLDGNGTLVKSSSGTITLHGINDHARTHLKNGQTNIANDNALGRGVVTMENGTTLGFNSGVSNISGDNSFVLNGTATMQTSDGGQTVKINGDINGTGKLVKAGEGTLYLIGGEDGKNPFTGGLDINAGRVKVESQDALGAGLVRNRSELELLVKTEQTLNSDNIDSTQGKFIKSGSGRLNFEGRFETSEFEMVNGGTIAVNLEKGPIVATNGFTLGGDSKLIGILENSEGLDRGEESGRNYLALDGANSEFFSKSAGNATLDAGTLLHIDWSTYQDGDQLYYRLWAEAYSESYKDLLSYNPEQAAIGADSLPVSNEINVALSKLTSADDIVKAFSELHGEVYKTALYAEADMQRNFNDIIMRRGILCEDCYCFKGFRGQSEVGKRELWATFTGGGNFRGQFDNFSGYNMGRWGVVTGLEQMFARGTFIGAAIGYDKADLSLKELPSKDSFYAMRFSTYLNYTYSGWNAIGYLGYTKNWHEVTRQISFMDRTAKGKYDNDVWSYGAELRYTFHWNTVDFIPSFGFNYVHVDNPYITESGAGAASLHLDSQKYESCRVPFGFRVNSRFDLQDITLRPELRMFYVAEAKDSTIMGVSAFSADPSKTFFVDSGIRGRSAYRIGVGLQAKIFDRLLMGVDYDAEIWSGYSRHDVGANLTVRW